LGEWGGARHMTEAEVPPAATADRAADEVQRRWAEHCRESCVPGIFEAATMPQLVLDVLGLPEGRFDQVAGIWDQELHKAVAMTLMRALEG